MSAPIIGGLLTASFWDEAHLERSIPLLGDTQAEDYAKVFDQVGPFSHEVANARSVLEVGPGLARWLQSLAGGVTRRAIEISPVNRAKLAALGITAYPPEDVPIADPVADIAVALSVFQHCKDPQVEDLLEVAHRALRPGCSLYCNGIALMHGYTFAPGGVSFSRPLDSMIRLALAAKLQVAGVLEYRVPGLCVTAWNLRLVK
jgi:SAM-dependent methyltransferase